jgi:hypothetical protein
MATSLMEAPKRRQISEIDYGRTRNNRVPEPEELVRREFTVSPDGRTVAGLLAEIKLKKYLVSQWAENAMYRPEFVPESKRYLTNLNELDIGRSRISSGSPRTLVIIPGEELRPFDPTETVIRAEATKRGLWTPLPEDGPLMRMEVSDEEMKILNLDAVVVMHEPVIDVQGLENLFCILRFPPSLQKYEVVHHHLDAVYKRTGAAFPRTWGFAFVK